MNTPTKRCACGEKCINPDGYLLPATPEYFGSNRSRKDGFNEYCRECARKIKGERYLRLKETGEAKKHRADYYQKNKQKVAAANKSWRDNNKEVWTTINRNNVRAYREKTSGKEIRDSLNITRVYSAQTIERGVYKREYYQKNKVAYRARNIRRRALQKGASGSFTGDDIRLMFKAQKGKCWWCGEQLGSDFHIDHRVPLSRGGSNDPSNLCLSCAPCNLAKSDKLPHEWIGRLL